MKALIILTALVGMTGCFRVPPPPTDAVPCLVLTPRTDALRAGLKVHPDTPDAVGVPAAAIILGTEAVCKNSP